MRKLLAETGFEVIAVKRETIRRDGNDLIGGLLVTARKLAGDARIEAVETPGTTLSPLTLHGQVLTLGRRTAISRLGEHSGND